MNRGEIIERNWNVTRRDRIRNDDIQDRLKVRDYREKTYNGFGFYTYRKAMNKMEGFNFRKI